MQDFTSGAVLSSIVASLIIAWFIWLKDVWFRLKRSEASINLATSSFEFLDATAKDKTRNIISKSKEMGDDLVSHYKFGSPIDDELKNELIALLEGLVAELQPYISKLTAARSELDHVRGAVMEYAEGLKRRLQIVKHLCAPPNPNAMDPGHVREQLLSVNCDLDGLLNAARGEAAIFLRGYGINWLKRWKHKRRIQMEQRKIANREIAKKYRSILQQTAFAARK